jgi:hypothetical protein
MKSAARRNVWICLFFGALVLGSGCTHQPKRVDCDGRLEPINPPTPVAGAKKSNELGSKP